jgi:hypothetical protein
MEEARFHTWQHVLCATVHEVRHGTAERALESSICREAFNLRRVENATAAVSCEAQAPAHGRKMQLAASVLQDIWRFSHHGVTAGASSVREPLYRT